MSLKEKLNSFTVKEIKKIINVHNELNAIKGYSKLNKTDLVNLLINKHADAFKDLKNKKDYNFIMNDIFKRHGDNINAINKEIQNLNKKHGIFTKNIITNILKTSNKKAAEKTKKEQNTKATRALKERVNQSIKKNTKKQVKKDTKTQVKKETLSLADRLSNMTPEELLNMGSLISSGFK